jgi:hypothetical protein
VATEADVRRLALALPEAYEDVHRRAPAFRVNARIFGMLRDDPPHLVLKLEREDQLNMLEGFPDVVSPGRHYSHHGWTRIDYRLAEPALLETLVRLAWTHVAPRRLRTS